ncbi:ribonuclease inhibitor-like [Zonotrichia albicollis]|uniref:ribonuclease inhibitor-like n=1 Tax=Zonotrichia albicollis TaxID=44394 RepID=UPI003D80BA37
MLLLLLLSTSATAPPFPPGAAQRAEAKALLPCFPRSHRLGSCRLAGTSCPALAARLLQGPRLSCLDLSDIELRAQGVLQLCQQLRHPACPLRSLGLSTDGFSQALLQELDALRALQPGLNIGNLLEHDVPQAGAMARLPCHRGVLPGGRKALPSFRRPPIL